MVVWGKGFLGWGFQWMGFWACGVGPSGFFGLRSPCKHRKLTLGKNGAALSGSNMLYTLAACESHVVYG